VTTQLKPLPTRKIKYERGTERETGETDWAFPWRKWSNLKTSLLTGQKAPWEAEGQVAASSWGSDIKRRDGGTGAPSTNSQKKKREVKGKKEERRW